MNQNAVLAQSLACSETPKRNLMVDSLIKLLFFQATGEIFTSVLAIPVLGPVIGMLFLFLYLVVRGKEDKKLAGFSAEFLRHLTLLFIPAAVGIMLHLKRVSAEWRPILAALTTSTLVSIVVTAFTIHCFKKSHVT